MATESNQSGPAPEITAKVSKAFDAARQGDFQPLGDLQGLGPAVVPLLAPYLDDPDESIRREAVILLKVLGGPAALPLLERALVDPSADLRGRAAAILYERDDLAVMIARGTVGEALRKSVRQGNPSAAAVLLLAYFPGEETEQVLRDEQAQPATELTKLDRAPAPVSRSLPATIALSRVGATGGRKALIEVIERGRLEDLTFLLTVLREVDAPEVLHVLKATFDDQRETGSGAPVGVEQPRRLCDDAVDAFVRRLGLKVDFERSEAKRYNPVEIDAVRGALESTVPQ